MHKGLRVKRGKKRTKVPGRLGSWPVTTAEALAATKKHSNTQTCPGGAKAGGLGGTLAQTLNTRYSLQNSNTLDVSTSDILKWQ